MSQDVSQEDSEYEITTPKEKSKKGGKVGNWRVFSNNLVE